MSQAPARVEVAARIAQLEAELASARAKLAQSEQRRAQATQPAPAAPRRLAMSELLLRQAEHIAGLGVWSWDPASDQVQWSDGMYALFGVPLHVTPTAELYFSSIHPDDRERVRRGATITLGSDKPANADYRLLRADGSVRHVTMRVEPMRSPDGPVVAFIGTVLDISERVQTELALRESEARWRSIAINPFHFVSIVDRQGVFQWVNYATPPLHEKDLVGKASVFDFLRAEDHAAARAALARAFEQQAPAYYDAYSPFFERWYSTAVGPLVRDGTVVAASTHSRDITDAKRAEVELRKRERMLAEAQRIAGVGSWVWDKASGKLQWSDEMYRICGVAPEVEPTDALYYSLVHPDDRERARAAAARALQTRVSNAREHRILRASDQSVRHVLVASEVTTGDDGEITGSLGTTLDVTERRTLEAQLLHSMKLEAVGRLAGGVAHDFNNVLTVIMGNVSVVERALGERSESREHLQEIRAAAQRASGLTRQLLAFARKQIIAPEALSPNAIIENLVRLLRPVLGEDIQLSLQLAGDVWPVLIDRGQFEQLLLNLAVNARDAMPRGGALSIETRNAQAHERRLHPELEPGSYVCVQVRDTGHGIPRELLQQVFEPFFTTKGAGQGTGLGLAQCHGIVKQHGGHIWVTSEPGAGATFTIHLPRAQSAPKPALASSEPPARRHGSETVLLVEDEAMVRKLCVDALGELGYQVLPAGSAAEALRVAADHSGPIDLLLTDLVLPDQRGNEVAAALAARSPSPRVLYMSGYAEGSIAQAGVLQAGARFLHKPYTLQALAAAVRKALDE